MRVAVLSGKGGAGKTMVAVNLAAAARRAVYIDCDVEEPNGRLFLKPENVTASAVSVTIPAFDASKCSGCRRCAAFCRFHALAFIKGAPRLFTEMCHGCGGCALVCPSGAVQEVQRPIGTVECGCRGGVEVVTGALNPGEASGVRVIRAALDKASSDGLTVIDCPPGSACTVMESIAEADLCLLVTEPTAFGLHNMRMVHELARLMAKPCAVVINKAEGAYLPLEEYCAAQGLPVALRMPFRREIAAQLAAGGLLYEVSGEAAGWFDALLEGIGGAP